MAAMSKSHQVTRDFEEAIAAWAGSKYAVAVESCTAALFLSLMYVGVKGKNVSIPKFTYPSVACSIIHAGGKVVFSNEPWSGMYELFPYRIYDSALRFHKGMYKGGLHCLSFHSKKLLPIGRGGMILTDDEKAYKWLKKARFDGRDEVALQDDPLDMVGWNMYLSPEQSARGLALFEHQQNEDIPDLDSTKQNYPDLSLVKAYK